MSKQEPAFPRTEWADPHNEVVSQDSGMSLRDYFAAKAMQGMLANNSIEGVNATSCYQIADAMLKQREVE